MGNQVTQTTPTTQKVTPGAGMRRAKLMQMSGILLLVAGRGWAAGTFAPGTPWWDYLVLSIPIVIVGVLALGFFQKSLAWEHGEAKNNWASIGLHIYSALSLVLAAASIAAGQSGANTQFFGARTPAELVPTIIIGVGALAWLVSLIPFPAQHASAVNSAATN